MLYIYFGTFFEYSRSNFNNIENKIEYNEEDREKKNGKLILLVVFGFEIRIGVRGFFFFLFRDYLL